MNVRLLHPSIQNGVKKALPISTAAPSPANVRTGLSRSVSLVGSLTITLAAALSAGSLMGHRSRLSLLRRQIR